MIFITTAEALNETIEAMNKETRDWTMQAARGECSWTCSDCGSSFSDGMPSKCVYDISPCTDIIIRDKNQAGAKL